MFLLLEYKFPEARLIFIFLVSSRVPDTRYVLSKHLFKWMNEKLKRDEWRIKQERREWEKGIRERSKRTEEWKVVKRGKELSIKFSFYVTWPRQYGETGLYSVTYRLG